MTHANVCERAVFGYMSVRASVVRMDILSMTKLTLIGSDMERRQTGQKSCRKLVLNIARRCEHSWRVPGWSWRVVRKNKRSVTGQQNAAPIYVGLRPVAMRLRLRPAKKGLRGIVSPHLRGLMATAEPLPRYRCLAASPRCVMLSQLRRSVGLRMIVNCFVRGLGAPVDADICPPLSCKCHITR